MAGHAKANARRAWVGFPPKLPTQREFEHAAFVARELAAPVPKIDVEGWWRTQTNARRHQTNGDQDGIGAVGTCGDVRSAGEIREVREHEVDVLQASDLANHSEIRSSLCKLMPYLEDLLNGGRFVPANEEGAEA
jgi:type IV secretion system protein VirD4